MCRIVTISGLSFTGTTTLASELAQALGWNVLSAGQRFREYCATERVSLTSIPNEVHEAFDIRIQQEIRTLAQAVMEGRYLGFFARECDDVLTVWIHSNMECRKERCLARESEIITADDAENYILGRDEYEKSIGLRLYDLVDFTDPAQFDYVFENNTGDDPKTIVNRLVNAVAGAESTDI